jgi:hypothetical protein
MMDKFDIIAEKLISIVEVGKKTVPMAMLDDCYCIGPILQGRSINEMLVDVARKYGYEVV